MELHNRFVDIAGSESSVLDSILDSCISREILQAATIQSIKKYMEKLRTSTFSDKDLENLRLLLCQQYVSVHRRDSNSKSGYIPQPCEILSILTNFELGCLKQIHSVVSDTIILLLALLSSQRDFIFIFQDFRNAVMDDDQDYPTLADDWYLRLLDCFLQTLRIFLCVNHENISQTDLDSNKNLLLLSIISDVGEKVACQQNEQYVALHALSSTIIQITQDSDILCQYFSKILQKDFSLSTVCALSDLLFPTDCSSISIDFSSIFHKNILTNIQNELISGQSDERKQALYIFKRLHNFIDNYEQNHQKTSTEVNPNGKLMNSGICDRMKRIGLPPRQLRMNIIIMMEALEEKQKHLVIPTLSLLDSLAASSLDDKANGECFDFSWIHCIFSRVLVHDNNAVVKWGLLKVLQLNAEAYYHTDLIKLLVRSLNNTFLYEKQSDEIEPKIVTSLTEWFNNCQSANLPLVERFLNLCVEEMWCPVAIYYVLQSLSCTSDDLCSLVNLKQKFFKKMKILVEKNIKLHPPMLRLMSQVMLIKVLSRFSKVENLYTVSDLLSVLSEIDSTESYRVSLVPWFTAVENSKASKFVEGVSKSLFLNAEGGAAISTFAFVIVSLYEAKVIFQDRKCQATQILMNLFLNLSKADVRPYVNFEAQMKIIELLHHLLTSKSKLPKYFYDLYTKFRETIFRVILKSFHNDAMAYEHVKICNKVLQLDKYAMEPGLEFLAVISDDNRKEMEKKCVDVVCNAHQHTAMQILLAVQLWSSISNHFKYDEAVAVGYINNLLDLCQNGKHAKEFTGKLAIDYYTGLSEIMRNHVLSLQVCNGVKVDYWIETMSTILDAAGNNVLVYFGEIMRFLTDVIVNNVEHMEKFKYLTKSFWRCNFGSKREKMFWVVAQKLTESINSSNFLKYEALQDVSAEFIEKMLSEGDSLGGLKLILLMCSDMKSHHNYFIQVILEGLVQGQVMRRDQRITMQAYERGSQFLDKYPPKDGKVDNFDIYEFINRQSNLDATIRAAAILRLMNILSTEDSAASMILPLALEKFATVQNKRYYADSQVHRLKHRILQVLLVLQPHLVDEESLQILYHTMKMSIIKDSDQHSVRMMEEWLLIRIYLSHKNFLNDLWFFFDEILEKRPGIISSIIGIIWHITLHIKKEESSEFIGQALTKLKICCMGQQFNMRLFSQVFYVKLYNLLDENSDKKLKHKDFYMAVLKSLDLASSKTNHKRIEENFFYSIFNPIEHYDLETLYHQLPRLSNVNPEEWVTKENFLQQMCVHSEIHNPLNKMKIANSTSALLNESVSDYFLKSGDRTKPEEIECSEDNTDFQRKIKTWKRISPIEKDVLEIETDSTHTLKNKEDIIIVASLVEKPQNLGGIARTCEIFRVRDLVISNLKQTEDKEFQALSVSADKWINISEVKHFSLVEYLMELKSFGWTLIGAEQTAQSVNLIDLKFPKQTVLILGNEKNGIPANIIPILDLCVEIPQAGVIRSLNVHVTSAICIWEYIKQHGQLTQK